MHLCPPPVADAAVCSVVMDSLLIVTPIVGLCNYSMFCYALPYVNSSIAITLMGAERAVCFA